MTEHVMTGDMHFTLEELADFLVVAKKSCYAGGGKEVRLADSSKQLTFQQGDFHYTDNYAGYFQAPGTETVRWQKPDGKRIWQMAYSGGMLPGCLNDELTRNTFAFLKKALLQVSSEAPFRGPLTVFEEGDFKYWIQVIGNIKRFRGEENMCYQNQRVFEQDFIGGLVIPK